MRFSASTPVNAIARMIIKYDIGRRSADVTKFMLSTPAWPPR
jgi:hypothetical protein